MSDPMQAIIEAEGLVRARKMERESLQRDYRSPMALEMIADEMNSFAGGGKNASISFCHLRSAAS